MSTSPVDPTANGRPRREDPDEAPLFARLVTGALRDCVAELRKDEEARLFKFTTTFQEEISAFRESEEARIARLEKAIANWKSGEVKADPTTNFWTVYKKVADEHDNDMVSGYIGDLDTSLLFAGLFSAVTSAFIVQINPELQPNPADLTNVLLLRILQQNASFDGTDPLSPISSVPDSVTGAQSILLACLSITLFVAFVSVLGKQWILYYTRVTTWGNIADRGKERQAKLVGLQKWGLHLIMDSLPVMLQFALLLFGVALATYLWDLNLSVAGAALAVTSVGLVLYTCIAVAAATHKDCPFQTPLSVSLSKVPLWTRQFTTLARTWLRRKATSLLLQIKGLNRVVKATPDDDYPMTLSNPAFWRDYSLFPSPVPNDIGASAGFWLLESSTDFSATAALATVFSEFQWPSHQQSTTALIRLRDMYVECFRAPESKKSTRLGALQSAAAYYVLYHTQLIWNTWSTSNTEVEGVEIPPDLPPDLLLHLPCDEWGGDDLFEYLLHLKNRSEPGTSARFLSYIAPYWFCGDSDPAIRFRPFRLQTLYELIEVLEESRTLNPATLADCILCVGAAMDFPLHPEDLIRIDKRCVLLPYTSTVGLIRSSDHLVHTFEMVVEHVHSLALARGPRHYDANTALEILLTLAEKTALPLIDAEWINELLKHAVIGNLDDGTFTLFLRLSARREEDGAAEVEIPQGPRHTHVQGSETDPQPPGGTVPPESINPVYPLFIKILQNVQTCSAQEGGWQDEAVYGGLVAMRDIPQLGSCLPGGEFLRTLSKAMQKSKPYRIRKAAYNVVLVARDGWLNSSALREILEALDFPRQLHSVLIETGRSDHQRLFLTMMEILSEDKYYHPYLRGAMEIWLPSRHEGPDQVLRILARVCELSPSKYDRSNPPLDEFLEKLVEDEWAGVPGRPTTDLTVDRLEPLAVVTVQFKDLLFSENDRRAVLAVVEQVIPSLERRRDGGYEGPGDGVRGVVNALLGKLREPMRSTSRPPAYW